jgi:hypothetical protein
MPDVKNQEAHKAQCAILAKYLVEKTIGPIGIREKITFTFFAGSDN